jgi:hypothetical protein
VDEEIRIIEEALRSLERRTTDPERQSEIIRDMREQLFAIGNYDSVHENFMELTSPESLRQLEQARLAAKSRRHI